MADDFLKTNPELDDEQLIVESKRAINYLQVQRNYRYVEFLAQGGYGWVSLVYDDTEKRPLAIKCTIDTSDMELTMWPKLEHETILPLIEYITLDSCTVFVMPAMRKDLWMCVTEPRFYQDELSFGQCRIWLRDVATALDYLHKQNLCHLDLKLDNVFLKDNGRVCLGDFSLLSDSREVPAMFHFLELYEPPEYTDWCHGTPPSAIAEADQFGGDKADMWQYGILALDLLTNLSLSGERSNYFTLWHHDVWPFVQKVLLHKEYMEYLMEDTFENVFFNELDFELCHDFLAQILVIEPNVRASAAEVMRHEFVTVDWPHIPTTFGMPKQILAHPSKKRGKEMKKKPSDEDEEEDEMEGTSPLEESTSQTADVLKQKMEKLQNEKKVRRQSLAAIAGKNSLMIRHNISGMDVEANRSTSQDFSMSDVDVRDNVVIKNSVEVNKRNKNGNRNPKSVSIAPHRKLQAKIDKDPTKSTSSQLGRSSRSSTRQISKFLSSSSRNVKDKSPVKKRSNSKGESPVRKRSNSKDKSSTSGINRSPSGKKSPGDRKKSPNSKKSIDGKKSPSNSKKSPRDKSSESNRGKSKSPSSKKSPSSPKSKTSSVGQKKTAGFKSPNDKNKSTSKVRSPSDKTSSQKGANPKKNISFEEHGNRKVSSRELTHQNPDKENATGNNSAKDRRKSVTSSQKNSDARKNTSTNEQGSRKVSSHEISHKNADAPKDKIKATGNNSTTERRKSVTSSQKNSDAKKNTSTNEQGSRKVSSHEISHKNAEAPKDKKKATGNNSTTDRKKSVTSSQKNSDAKKNTSTSEQGSRKVSSHEISHQKNDAAQAKSAKDQKQSETSNQKGADSK